ncbi:hypothetical protein BGX26_010716 [Mortierella sp. AD094]|nr:hypothetical protein BGX26_010716 [Mortierella sp. AD094]
MSLLSRYFRQSLVSARMNTAAPLAAVVPHWNRSFSNSSQSFKKDVIKNAPGWNAENATDSEADVKADRERLPKNMEQLQEETIEFVSESELKIDGQPVRRATERLNKKLEKFGDKVGMDISVDSEITEETVEDMARHAQTAGAKLGKVTGTIKGKIEDLEENFEEEVTQFVESVKKKIGHQK